VEYGRARAELTVSSTSHEVQIMRRLSTYVSHPTNSGDSLKANGLLPPSSAPDAGGATMAAARGVVQA
jgi:hypothetical protein